MDLRKGMRVRQHTKKDGQAARTGTVLSIHGQTVEVRWDDGQVSSPSHSFLFPIAGAGH